MTSGHLPVGMQLIARPFEEATLVRMVRAWEQTSGLTMTLPQVHDGVRVA